MPYSRNPKTVENWKAYLDQLLNSSTDIAWESANTHMLGYYLRQAMTIAQKQKIAPYEGLKDKWTIRDRGDRILAELKSRAPIETLKRADAKLILAGLVDLPEIVGACIEHKADEMYFPEGVLDEQQTKVLYLWSSKNGYHIIIGNGVTVTKTDPGDIAWVPPESL